MGLLDNDRATLLGALLDLSGQLRGTCDTDPAHLRARWHQHRLRTSTACAPSPPNAMRLRTDKRGRRKGERQ